MSWFDVTDPAALEAALDAVELGSWIEVVAAGGPSAWSACPVGGTCLATSPSRSGDVDVGRPASVEVLGDLYGEDPYDERDGSTP